MNCIDVATDCLFKGELNVVRQRDRGPVTLTTVPGSHLMELEVKS